MQKGEGKIQAEASDGKRHWLNKLKNKLKPSTDSFTAISSRTTTSAYAIPANPENQPGAPTTNEYDTLNAIGQVIQPITKPVSPLDQAIERLNKATEQLNEVCGDTREPMEDISMSQNNLDDKKDILSLNTDTLDSEIDKVRELTNRLISQMGSQETPATTNFLQGVQHILLPTTKTILKVASCGSSMVLLSSVFESWLSGPNIKPFFGIVWSSVPVNPCIFLLYDLNFQLLQTDSERKASFERELKDIQNHFMILRLHASVPKRFENLKQDVQIRGLDVLSAILNLICEQFLYVNTNGGKLGTTLNEVFNNVKYV